MAIPYCSRTLVNYKYLPVYVVDMASQGPTEISSIGQLTEGDTVHITGNGNDVYGEVTEIGYNDWKDRQQAWVEADGVTVGLYDNTHALMSDGVRSTLGTVTVTAE